MKRGEAEAIKLSLSDGRQFNRIAVISDKRWMKVAGKVSSWFIGGEYKVFESEADGLVV